VDVAEYSHTRSRCPAPGHRHSLACTVGAGRRISDLSKRQRAVHDLLLDLLTLALRLGDVVAEFARRDSLLEHLVELLVGATLGLGVAVVCVDAAEHRKASEDKRCLGLEVGFVGVEHEGQHELPHALRRTHRQRELSRTGETAHREAALDQESNRSRLGAEPAGSDFCHACVRRRTKRDVVDVAVQDDHADGGLVGSDLADTGESSGNEEDDGEDDEAPEGERTPSNPLD
jgi:hypothetical protein